QFPALLSTPAFPDGSRNIFEGEIGRATCRERVWQTIRLWPAEVYSRGDRSGLPFRRIWESNQSNFPPCSQPQHFRTVQGIFSRETSGCGLILLVIGKPSDFGPQRYTLAATGVVCPFAESGNPLNPISRLALNPSISGRFKEYFRGS